MNYIGEINAFERWLENNYLELAPQLMMYKFYKLSNKAGWPEWVTVDNLKLMAEMKTKREATVVEWRDKLIENGLLQYKKGKKGQPNKYKINPLYTTDTEVQTVVNTEVQTVTNTADLSKHKQKHKLKHNNTSASLDEFFNSIWELYPKKYGKGSVSKSQKQKLQKIGFDELSRCVERYKQSIDGKDMQYVKNGSTFFNSGYVDFLDNNWQGGSGNAISKPSEESPWDRIGTHV